MPGQGNPCLGHALTSSYGVVQHVLQGNVICDVCYNNSHSVNAALIHTAMSVTAQFASCLRGGRERENVGQVRRISTKEAAVQSHADQY